MSVSIDRSSDFRVSIPSSVLMSKFRAMPMPEEISVFSFIVDFCLDVEFYKTM